MWQLVAETKVILNRSFHFSGHIGGERERGREREKASVCPCMHVCVALVTYYYYYYISDEGQLIRGVSSPGWETRVSC